LNSPSLSIVIPALNEKDNIFPLLNRLEQVLGKLPFLTEIIFVDDGSTDGTAEEVMRAHADDARVGLIKFSRNFGHEAAVLAGLDYAKGEAVVVMDADLQHPPEVIPELVSKWQAGADLVQTIRKDEAGGGFIKRWTSRLFYLLIQKLTAVPIIPGATNFFLINRKALRDLLQCREHNRFNRGLIAWIGFQRDLVKYTCQSRHSGETKYTFYKMLVLALNAIFSFSVTPLRIAGIAGLVIVFLSTLYLIFVLCARFFTTKVISGWTSIIGLVTLFGGMQLIIAWIMGEYIARIAEESRRRPHYAVAMEILPSQFDHSNPF